MNATYRLRICYAKQGRGAHLSHLEVIRALERIVRRARLPFATSQGFSPHMKASFGPALAVGTASESEYFDVILNEFVDPDGALDLLRDAAPEVLPILSCGYVSAREPSLSAAISILEYRVLVGRLLVIPTELPSQLEVDQKGKTKQFDTQQVLPLGLSAKESGDETTVTFTIRTSDTGVLRPDALMDHLLQNTDDPESPYAITRTATLMEDDDGTWRAPLPA